MYVSRHHPVSSNAPVSHGGASSKWSKKQDQKLKQAVQKYGTQWSLISRKYRFDRSVNSLVKRWHGKLKDEVLKGVKNNNESNGEEEQKQEVEKTKKIRKLQTKQEKSEKLKKRRGGYRRGIPRSMSIRKARRQSLQNRARNRKPSQVEENEEKENQKMQMDAIEKKSELQGKEENSKNEEQNIDSIENQDPHFIFQHDWKEYDDTTLKELILGEKILNWEDLASRLKIENVSQVRKRWRKHVYPSITESKKIGGCLKYSEEEDSILNRGVKLGMTVMELRKFLPERTPYSLEARRRRTLKDEQQVPELRYWTKKLLAYKFVEKRHAHLEKPTSEDEFMYKSESE